MPILTTKLYRTPVMADVEPRTAVLERLAQNRQRPLTLISAPAGYGKTTLASMWLEASDCPGAWVSLDEGDNDLGTFTGYLVAALQRAFPDAKLETQALLQAPAMPPAPVVARYLLNDLDQITQPFILALDDVYMIHEQAIFDLLGELLRHPARALHLLLITRRDPPLPIASLRARRQITEVRARDLRMTAPEAARLLSKMLQRDIDEATAAEWTQRTEGWVTALQLAALSLRHRNKDDAFRVDILGDSRYLQDYLLSEVLEHLPPDRQEWLLATSLLDRFCAPLVDAVCRFDAASNESASAGAEFVRWLDNENLFLIPLDDQQRWFRFHHLFQSLLRERLRRRLSAENVAALHLRVGRWFDDNGLWDEALRHFLAAEDTSAAVEHVISHRYELINSQQWQRLFHWLHLLPADVVTQNPYLASAITFLATHMHSMEHSEVRTRMQQAEQALTALPPGRQEYQVVQAEIATNQGAVAIMAGDAVLAEALARRSLDVLPEQAMLTRQLANAVIGASMQMRGEYHAGVSRIKEVLVGSDLPAAVRSHSLHSLCLVRMMEGDLNGVIASALECLRTSEGSGNRWMQNHARHHLGVAHYLRNEIELAEPYLSALHNDRATSAPSYLAFGAFALALICASKHQWDQAQQVVESLSSQFDDINSRFAIEVTKAFSVELAIRRGDIAHAQQLSGQIDYGLRPPMWFFYVPQLTPLKLLWAESTPEGLARARVTLEALDERMAAIHRKAVRIDVLSLMALVCDAQGETTTACDKLAQALKLAEPGGFIRNFVDLGPPMADLLVRFQRRNQAMTPEMQRHLERILAAFYSSRARDAGSFTRTIPAKSASVELLTPRELQILRLLATELSPHEIAGELVMSTSTVRTHIKNIYAKMAVHSRMEAVHRAGVLRLQ